MANSDFGFGVQYSLIVACLLEHGIANYAAPGTLFALMGMPLTTFISRRQLDLVTSTRPLTTQ